MENKNLELEMMNTASTLERERSDLTHGGRK
jgi:hypothetical protein